MEERNSVPWWMHVGRFIGAIRMEKVVGLEENLRERKWIEKHTKLLCEFYEKCDRATDAIKLAQTAQLTRSTLLLGLAQANLSQVEKWFTKMYGEDITDLIGQSPVTFFSQASRLALLKSTVRLIRSEESQPRLEETLEAIKKLALEKANNSSLPSDVCAVFVWYVGMGQSLAIEVAKRGGDGA